MAPTIINLNFRIMSRFNEIYRIAVNVEKGIYPTYTYSTNSLTEDAVMRKVWMLAQGHYSAYRHDKDAGGITMVIHRPHMSTTVHMANLDEVAETLAGHEENFAKYVEDDIALGKYLSSDEGAWGR